MINLRFFILILSLVLISLSAKAQDDEMQTLTGSVHHSGGYGALIIRSSSFRDQSLVMAGGRGMWVINRAFGIGFEGNGVVPVNTYEGVDPTGLNDAILVGGYGGLVLEPMLWSNKLVHITFPVSGGAGWIGYVRDWENMNHDPSRNDLYDQDIFWYVEPGASIELNVTRFFRAAIGVSQRFTQGLDLVSTPETGLNKTSFTLCLKFGRF